MLLLRARLLIFCPTCGNEPMNTLQRIIKRLREPSSMAGIAALALLFGVPAGAAEALVQVVGGLAAVAAIVIPESPSN